MSVSSRDVTELSVRSYLCRERDEPSIALSARAAYVEQLTNKVYTSKKVEEFY